MLVSHWKVPTTAVFRCLFYKACSLLKATIASAIVKEPKTGNAFLDDAYNCANLKLVKVQAENFIRLIEQIIDDR
jgi:hypothetical protein